MLYITGKISKYPNWEICVLTDRLKKIGLGLFCGVILPLVLMENP